ncbi:unnamed protein product [Gadus morhua 'NCC']
MDSGEHQRKRRERGQRTYGKGEGEVKRERVEKKEESVFTKDQRGKDGEECTTETEDSTSLLLPLHVSSSWQGGGRVPRPAQRQITLLGAGGLLESPASQSGPGNLTLISCFIDFHLHFQRTTTKKSSTVLIRSS